MTDIPSDGLVRGRTTRRELLVLGGGAVAAVSLFGLSACGDSSGGSGDVVLSITPDYESIIKPMVQRFNEQNPDGPKVTIRMFPADTDQYFDRLRTQFQAGNADVDVIPGDVIWPPQFASNGWITDLSDRLPEAERDQYIPGAIAGNTYEGKLYGVPWFTDSGLLYYRSDLLEKSGFSEPPATWDELKQMAAKVQADAKVKNGFVFTGAVYEGGTVLGTEFIRTAGGDVLDGGKVTVSSPEAIRGLEIQQSLVADGIAPEAVANYKEDEASGAFLRGDTVFMRMWPYAYDLLSDKEQSSIEEGQVGLAQVPVADASLPRVNVGGGWNFFLNSESGDQDAGWKLIEYLTAPEQQKTMAIEGSYLPTRKALYEDPEIVEKLAAIRLGKEAVANTTTPPVSPYYSDLSAAMAEAFNGNALGKAPAAEIAGSLQGKLEDLISRGG